MALEIATGAAQLAETIVEIESSQWNIENTVATSITSTVTLHPDPRHHAFPQAPAGSTSHFVVRMLMRDGRATRVVQQVVPPSTPKTLTATFADNTLGGEVCFEVDYLINSWLAGRARSGWIANDEPHATDVVLYLVENPKPLNEHSVYIHSAILIYDNGHYAWQSPAVAPTETTANRSPAQSGNAISDWYGLTLSQRYAALGFAWKAAGMGIRSLPSGATGQLAAMQSVNIPGAEIEGAKFPSAGFDKLTQLMFDPYPAKFLIRDGNWVLDANNFPVFDPDDKRLGDYYVDPRPGDLPLSRGGGYHLRAVSSDLAVPFDLSPTPSFGRFEFPADSFVIHPSGAVIAVSRAIHKMQILRIAQTPTPDDDAVLAAAYGGQAMHPDRVGLLIDPVAVTCSGDGTIFVLESLKYLDATVGARGQAFDLNGNSVACFKSDGAMSPFLRIGGPSTTVLDIAAIGNEAATYIYVLSYENDGFQASDYSMSIYTRGTNLQTNQPMVTTPGLAAAKIAVDMWHSLYALNYAMTKNAAGTPAGPAGTETGPAGRTVPSVSEWLPPIPTS